MIGELVVCIVIFAAATLVIGLAGRDKNGGNHE